MALSFLGAEYTNFYAKPTEIEVTVPDNSLVLAFVLTSSNNFTGWAPAISGGGYTWNTDHEDVNGLHQDISFLYTAEVTTGGTVTVSWTPGASGSVYHTHLLVYAVPSGTVEQIKFYEGAQNPGLSGAYNGDFDSALQSADSHKISVAWLNWGGGGSEGITVGAGWTEDYDYERDNGNDPHPSHAHGQHITGTTDTGIDYAAFVTGTNRRYCILAVEVSEGGGGGTFQEVDTDSIESSTELDQMTVLTTSIASLSNIEATSEVSSMAIVLNHSVDLDDIEAESELSQITVISNHVVGLSSIEAVSELDQMTAVITNLVDLDDIEAVTQLDQITVEVTYSVGLNSIEANSEVSEMGIEIGHSVDLDSISSLSEVSSMGVVIQHSVGLNSIEALTEVGQMEVSSVDSVVDLDDLTALSEVSTMTVTVAHVVGLNSVESQSIVSRMSILGAITVDLNHIEAVTQVSQMGVYTPPFKHVTTLKTTLRDYDTDGDKNDLRTNKTAGLKKTLRG